MPETTPGVNNVSESPSDAQEQISNQAQQIDSAEQPTQVVKPGEQVQQTQDKQHETTVPYERFQQEIEKRKEFEQWNQAIEVIKERFGTPDKYREALEESQRIQREEEIAARVAQQNPGLDENLAAGMFQTELMKDQFSRAQQELNKTLYEQRLLSARSSYPEMDENYVKALAKPDGSNLLQVAQDSHNKEVAKAKKIEEQAIARYNSKKAEQQQSPPVEGSGGTIAPASTMPDWKTDRPAYDAWWAKELAKSEAKYG